MLHLLLTTGCLDGKDASLEIEPVYGVANIDDDDGNGKEDWEDVYNDDEDDLSELVISSAHFQALKRGESLRLLHKTNDFRVYLDGDLVMNTDDDYMNLDVDSEEDLILEIEMREYNSTGLMVLEKSKNSSIVDTIDIELISVPLLLNHHLQPMRRVYAMSGTGFVNNRDFIDGFENALGEDFTSYAVDEYDWDVWLQDEIEFGILSSPFNLVDVVVDSIRNRGLDDLPEDKWEGPNMHVQTWGSGSPNSQDSFGNLEVAPPVTVGDVDYPLGRIYYGNWLNDRVTSGLRDFLDNTAAIGSK